MPATTPIQVIESLDELKAAHAKAAPHLRARIKMLLAIAKGTTAVKDIAAKTGASAESVRIWKNRYRAGGLQALINEGRGGDKRSGITEEQKQKIAEKLANPKDAFRSYKEAQAWLKVEL